MRPGREAPENLVALLANAGRADASMRPGREAPENYVLLTPTEFGLLLQ